MSNRALGAGLFAVLLAIYFLGGGFQPLNDARVNALSADSLVWEGNLTFQRAEVPDMFSWLVHTPRGDSPVEISFFDDRLMQLAQAGTITSDPKDERFRYVVAPTTDPNLFVNTFGVGAALAALPILAPTAFVTGRLADHPGVLLWSSKLAAAALVAASAVLAFLTAILYVSPKQALLVGLAYGLGTGVWSTSSQALWQHGPNDFFLALAAWQLARLDRAPSTARAAGLALAVSAATFCRPTSALVAIVFGIYLAVRHRRHLLAYCLAGAPLAALLLAYNQHFFGHPLIFGQTKITNLALQKTGTAAIWQSGPIEGVAGLLVSPSRGLFVYSPFLLFGVWGAASAWQCREFLLGRALGPAVLAVWGVECLHFDWWGGWSYGYRHIVDTAGFMTLLVVPVLPRIAGSRVLGGLFGLALAWSVAVQFVGAIGADLEGWNAAKTYRVRVPSQGQEFELGQLTPELVAGLPADAEIAVLHRNVDEPEHQARLWSWRDNQILYHITHWSERREAKRRLEQAARGARPARLAETYAQLADAFARAGDLTSAREFVVIALGYDPASRAALTVKGGLLLAQAEDQEYTDVVGPGPERPRGWAIEAHFDMGSRFLRSPGWLMGGELLEQGEWEKAALAFAERTESGPGVAAALHGLGLARYEQGRIGEAIEHLTRAAELSPRDADLLADLGTILARAGDADGARARLLTALRLDPGDRRLQRRLERLEKTAAAPGAGAGEAR